MNNKKFTQALAKIETRLTDLGIGGKICRLSPLRNMEELINDEVKAGVKTIVVVGNDKTLSQIVNVAAKHEVPMGLIPLGPENQIAQALGIPQGEAACEIIAARIIKKIDLGRINNLYFLSGVKISDSDVTIECEDLYRITPKFKNAKISICNFKPLNDITAPKCGFDPEDGFLEIFIQPLTTHVFNFFRRHQPSDQSIIPFKRLTIRSKGSVPIITDGQKVLKTPVKIEIVPKKLRIIVGKHRNF